MKKLVFIFTLIGFLHFASPSFAQTDAALDFLKSKQDDTGRITTGFSAPSQWSAIAFEAYMLDVSTIKKSTNSLQDFLLLDIPTNNAATEWETRILAIVAIGGNPTDFNNTNYVTSLESFYTQNQIGDICSLNDDIFGLLALLAAGTTSQTSIKQGTLDFLLSKQDSDGGFGFSAPGCDWYSTSSDITAAAVQALIQSKQMGYTNPSLDSAITKAKNYLLANQNADGGFGYYGSSDTDTTGWVLMAFNALDMKDTVAATKAKAYLFANQSQTDGGFMAFDYGENALVSNATTTAHALIALSGKTWILAVYNPATVVPIAPIAATPLPTVTPTPTPNSGLLSISQDEKIYQTITITTTSSPRKRDSSTATIRTEDTQEVLGDETVSKNSVSSKQPRSKTVTVLTADQNPAYVAVALGSFLVALYFLLKRLRQRSKIY